MTRAHVALLGTVILSSLLVITLALHFAYEVFTSLTKNNILSSIAAFVALAAVLGVVGAWATKRVRGVLLGTLDIDAKTSGLLHLPYSPTPLIILSLLNLALEVGFRHPPDWLKVVSNLSYGVVALSSLLKRGLTRFLFYAWVTFEITRMLWTSDSNTTALFGTFLLLDCTVWITFLAERPNGWRDELKKTH